jgi:hypothetical protein
MLNVGEVSQIAGIGQLIEIDDSILGILVHKKPDDVTANKSRATRNHDIPLEFHHIYAYDYLC